jgi:hypothetical protein
MIKGLKIKEDWLPSMYRVVTVDKCERLWLCPASPTVVTIQFFSHVEMNILKLLINMHGDS